MAHPRLRVLFDIILLESLPQIFVGLRNGVSLALVIIVVAEMFIGSQDGLGHSVLEAQQLLDMPRTGCGYFRCGCARLWVEFASLVDRTSLLKLVWEVVLFPGEPREITFADVALSSAIFDPKRTTPSHESGGGAVTRNSCGAVVI